MRCPMLGPWLLVALSVPVEITGDGDCPSAVAVEEALRPLLAPGSSASREQVRLSRRQGRVLVELMADEGGPPVVREIDGDARCVDVARAVAVIVAAWQLERHPELRKEEPAKPRPAPKPAAPPPPPKARLRLDLGVGVAFAFDAAGASPSAVLRTSVVSASGWGTTVWAGGPRARAENLLDGSVEWFRPVLVVALVRRLPLGPWLNLDLSLGPSAAWVHAKAIDLPRAHTVSSWSPGVSAGARVSTGGPIGVWMAVDGAAWPRPTRLVVEPAAASMTLPTWEVWAGAGVLVRWPGNE